MYNKLHETLTNYRIRKVIAESGGIYYVVQRRAWYYPWWATISNMADSRELAEAWVAQFKDGSAYDWKGSYYDED